jgi:hypothetical protein
VVAVLALVAALEGGKFSLLARLLVSSFPSRLAFKQQSQTTITTRNASHSPVDVVWLVAIKRQILDSEKEQNLEDDSDNNESSCCDVDPIPVVWRLVKKAAELIRRNILARSI